MGRRVICELDDGREVAAGERHGMLYDPTGQAWPSCSLLIAPFEQGHDEDDSTEGRAYFGRKAQVMRGEIALPPRDLAGWRQVGLVHEIYYERAGTRAPGRFRHKFNREISWLKPGLKLHALFNKKIAEGPAILYSRRGCLRVELPEGCVIDDRGIVLP